MSDNAPADAVVAAIPANCLDCPKHAKINDRDPDDWFCDDDQAVVCTGALDTACDPKSKWLSDRHPNRKVSRSCRPYKLREESARPEWCPLVAAQT